ncbi:uncharacterized protein LOC143364165 [Halictus rubicundus]|uniref:uncharacterized protein LOC143364165 n=1 Tax=Halictus rubicundus TaxID=77578 RepID=UPI004035747F
MEAQFKGLVAELGAAKTKLTIYRNLVESADVNADILAFEKRVRVIEGLYDEFDRIQTQIEVFVVETPALETHLAERDQFENTFFGTLSLAERRLIAARGELAINSASTINPTPTPSDSHTAICLPVIQIPTFDGNYSQWIRFRDTFTSLVHDCDKLTDVDRLSYLVSSLSGPAARILESFSVSATNYNLAWSRLKQRYDDPEFLATRSLHQVDCARSSPPASDRLLHDFYVDDLLTGCDSVVEASALRESLEGISAKAGFSLRKWASNDPKAIGHVSGVTQNVEFRILDKEPKTLGLSWSVSSDQLFSSTQSKKHSRITKRNILAEIAQIFEPLGLIGPVIVKSRLFMQEFWQMKVGWDETLSQDLHLRWLNFKVELDELSSASCTWKHIRTADNPADILSRGFSAHLLIGHDLWWYGPSWLSLDAKDWPISDASMVDVPDARPMPVVHLSVTANRSQFEIKLLDTLRFAINCRYAKGTHTGHRGSPSVSELISAERILIRAAHNHYLDSDYRSLTQRKKLNKNSSLISLNPYLDEHGLIRVGGRLGNAPVPYEQTHLVVRPNSGPLAELIVRKEHFCFLRAGGQQILASVNSRYWIISGRRIVRKVLRRCVTCFRTGTVSAKPLMGNLPADRVTPARPFHTCGVDSAGPLIVVDRGRSRTARKAYICIFVCMVTKAIHLERVVDLPSNAFISCLRRFIARRGKCKVIHSDNGTNLVGARNELYTLLTRVEACLNSRPIHPLSADPSDLNSLTPGHFLIGDALTALPQVDLTAVRQNRLCRFQLIQQRLQHFWKRWCREHLNGLQQRHTWKVDPPAEPRTGAMVLIQEHNTPPMKLMLGRILELHPGHDGKTPAVSLRTASDTLKRPVTKICFCRSRKMIPFCDV